MNRENLLSVQREVMRSRVLVWEPAFLVQIYNAVQLLIRRRIGRQDRRLTISRNYGAKRQEQLLRRVEMCHEMHDIGSTR